MRVCHAVAGLDGVLVHIGNEDLVGDAGVAEQFGAGGGLGGKNEAGHRSSLIPEADPVLCHRPSLNVTAHRDTCIIDGIRDRKGPTMAGRFDYDLRGLLTIGIRALREVTLPDRLRRALIRVIALNVRAHRDT